MIWTFYNYVKFNNNINSHQSQNPFESMLTINVFIYTLYIYLINHYYKYLLLFILINTGRLKFVVNNLF